MLLKRNNRRQKRKTDVKFLTLHYISNDDITVMSYDVIIRYVNQLIGEGKNYSRERERGSRGRVWRGRSKGSRERWYPRQPRAQEDDSRVNNDTSIELDEVIV